jgi:hypothetical protein
MRTDKWFIEGYEQPVEAVCEALEQQDKKPFADSIRDVYALAKRVPILEAALFEIMKTTGTDCSYGQPTSTEQWNPPLEVQALEEVKRIRGYIDNPLTYFSKDSLLELLEEKNQ